MARATTVRFTDEIYARLDQASARTGMPVNSIVIAACLEWIQRHAPEAGASSQMLLPVPIRAAPRWATLRRALGQRTSSGSSTVYPFERFTGHAKAMLRLAQSEAERKRNTYIGTEHLLLASFGEGFHAAMVLANLGVDRAAVEAAITSHLIDETRAESRNRFVPTARVKKVIEMAFQLAGEAESSRVGTHHILLALSTVGGGIASRVLHDLGAPVEKIEREVASLKDPES